MTERLRFQRADVRDLDKVSDLWREAREWLASRGLDQWQYPIKRDAVLTSIAAGQCWLVYDGAALVGTLTLDANADPEFWTPEDKPDHALYLHRMIVLPARRGEHLGVQMLNWASEQARREGKHWLRLDAWRTNDALRRYYEGQGFEHVRTIDLPHRRSGLLFQRAVQSAQTSP